MDRLVQKNKDKVIDVLAERLCFERASVKLYDKVLERMDSITGEKRRRSRDGDYSTYGLGGYGDDVFRGMHEDIRHEQGGAAHDEERHAQEREERVVAEILTHLQEYRDQEKEHQDWLEGWIKRLGGDPRRTTEMARVSAREVAGIESVIMKDAKLPHLLHALLAAEHVDDAGWDLLVELADAAGDLEAKQGFERRLHEEEQHLAYLREALRAFSTHEILEEELESPSPRQEPHPPTT